MAQADNQQETEELQELVEPDVNLHSDMESGISFEEPETMLSDDFSVDLPSADPADISEQTDVDVSLQPEAAADDIPAIVEAEIPNVSDLNPTGEEMSILEGADNLDNEYDASTSNIMQETVSESQFVESQSPSMISPEPDFSGNTVNNLPEEATFNNAETINSGSLNPMPNSDDEADDDIEIYEGNADEPDESDEQLGVLYSSDEAPKLNTSDLEPASEDLEYAGNLDQPSKTRKFMPVFAVLAAVVIAGAVTGFLLKNKNNIDAETLIQSSSENEALATPETDNSNILANTGDEIPMQDEAGDSAAENTPAPSTPDVSANKQVTKEVVKDVKESLKQPAPQKPLNSSKTITLKKLSWEVPDYLSYSDNIKKYLQTAGKSIRLTLSSDLLLTDEYIYSNQVKVSLKLSKDGNIQNAQIAKSSGSGQVDKIVLQTVKDTLSVVKPPQGEVPTPNYSLALIIYL